MVKELTPKQERFVAEYLIDLNATQAAIRAGYSLPHCDKPRKYYVYFLTDSRNGEIFYIGKGKRQRFARHIREWITLHTINCKKTQRIGEIIKAGGAIIPRCFAQGLTENDAYAIERVAIASIGLSRLTNLAPGQFTKHERDRVEAQLTLKRIKPFCQWLNEKPREPNHIKWYWDIIGEYSYIASGQYLRGLTARGLN